MKLKIVWLTIVLILVASGNAYAAGCFDSDCHGTSSNMPAPHVSISATCTDCHRDDDSCTKVPFISGTSSSGTSGTSSSGINVFKEIVPMEDVKASAVDTWKTINGASGDGIGIGTFLLGGAFLLAILSIVGAYLGGVALGAIGGATKQQGISTTGANMIAAAGKYSIALPIGIIGLGMMFAFL